LQNEIFEVKMAKIKLIIPATTPLPSAQNGKYPESGPSFFPKKLPGLDLPYSALLQIGRAHV